jgi:hypothetical protein
MQVLVELVALVGWLANSSDDTAQLVGGESDIPRVLADHLAARLPALQVCYARVCSRMLTYARV